METGERLSAYLAGELDADDAAALEAELAGDAALRAQLERIRAANEAMATLPEVEPPADFSTRLRATLSEEIARREEAPEVDELAQRRLRRRAGLGRGAGLAVAAAAVLVVGAVGLTGVLRGLGGDDADTSASALRGDRETMQATGPADPLAEYVRVTDTDHDAESVQALAQREGVSELPGEVDEAAAAELETERYVAFGLLASPTARLEESGDGAAGFSGGSTGAGTTTGGGDTGTDGPVSEPGDVVDEQPEAPQPAPQADAAAPAEDPLTDVRRCLPEIVSTANQPVIPLYAEVARFQGEPAIIYLVLTREPDARLFNRIEAWVVGRADCFPLLLTQVAR